ncbi:MAG: DinB family protein [Chloroflexi bacterium]|nr:DinB family protein [Chloroflexota bacterium]
MEWQDWIIREFEGLAWAFSLNGGGQVPRERWTERPDASPSIAWTLWHVARTQDLIVNVILRGRPQVLDAGFGERLGSSSREIGTSMAETDLANFDAVIHCEELERYWHAVLTETKSWLATADLTTLDQRPPTQERLRSAGVWHAAGGEWLPDFWGQQSGEFLLRFPSLAHGYMHFGESQVVAARLGYKGS